MKKYKVAELVFGVETRREEAMYRLMDKYRPFEVVADNRSPVLFNLSMDDTIAVPSDKPVRVFDYDLTEDTASLRIYEKSFILSITSAQTSRTYYMECWVPETSRTPIFRSDLATKDSPPPCHIVDHFLIFAFSVVGLKHNMLLIHASTIVYRGLAIMFLGESGTGKSTHSRMWLENIEGSKLLNDDAPAVRLTDDGVTVYGTPWSGKVPCYKNEQYPLAACVRIRRAQLNRMHRQSPLLAFGAMLPSALPTLQQQERTLDEVCRIVSGVLEKAAVFVLDCQPNADAAAVCREGIFKNRSRL